MIASLMRTLGMPDIQGELSDLRLRVAWFVAYAVVATAGVAFLTFAAYQGLARAMPPELAAVVLGLALLAVAGVLQRFAQRRSPGRSPGRSHGTDARTAPAAESTHRNGLDSAGFDSAGLDPAAELGRAAASLLRQTELGKSDLATASLVAGLVFGSRGFGSR
jgi:HAMP domain-containing protein